MLNNLWKISFFIILIVFPLFSLNNISAVEPDYTKYYLFVTKNTYTGAGNDPNGIDAICNKDVPISGTERPTNGTYKAYISRDGNYPGASLGIDNTRPIYRPDGITRIANNYLNLESGNWINTIFREDYVGMINVWTGIKSLGEQERDCNNWSSNTDSGYYGLVGFGAASDINTWAKHSYSICDGSSQQPSFYCIGPFENEIVDYCGDGICKGVEDAFNCIADCAPLLQKDRYFMFVTSEKYDGNLGGIEGANAKCNSDINKPVSGTFKAFLSSNINYPIIEGLDQTLLIYSAETLKKIANNFLDLIDGTLENPISPSAGASRIWTRGYNACDNWTSNSFEKTAFSSQFPNSIFSAWWDENAYSSCSEKHHLYCIGQYDGGDFCGDGIITSVLNEICDDGADNGDYGYCKNDCSGLGSHCGDGINNTGFETCDDGADNGKYNYCNSNCSGYITIGCGDTFCNNSETCSSCSADCGACSLIPTSSGGGGGSSGGGGGGAGGGGGGGGVSVNNQVIYQVKLEETNSEQGVTKEIDSNDAIEFYILNNNTEEKHTINLLSYSEDSATLEINSEPITIKILINETKKFDLNNDKFYDLEIKLNSIKNGKANLTIKTINEQIIIKQTGITGAFIGFMKTEVGILIIVIIIIVFGAIIIILISNKIKKRKIKKIEEENNFDKKKEKGKLKNSHSI